MNLKKILAWLEKQGEQNPDPRYSILDKLIEADDIYQMAMNDTMVEEARDKAIEALSKLEVSELFGKLADKTEPRFKVGDWVVLSTSEGEKVVQIESIEYFKSGEPRYITSEDRWFGNGTKAHLWTVQDAKDGEVLSYVTDEEDLWIMIYWSLYEPYDGHVHYHALLVNDNFTDRGTCCICIDNLKPATKEQRDLLFQKMKEAEYEWNSEKKELKKIEQKPADKIEPKFKVSDWV